MHPWSFIKLYFSKIKISIIKTSIAALFKTVSLFAKPRAAASRRCETIGGFRRLFGENVNSKSIIKRTAVTNVSIYNTYLPVSG